MQNLEETLCSPLVTFAVHINDKARAIKQVRDCTSTGLHDNHYIYVMWISARTVTLRCGQVAWLNQLIVLLDVLDIEVWAVASDAATVNMLANKILASGAPHQPSFPHPTRPNQQIFLFIDSEVSHDARPVAALSCLTLTQV